MTAANLWTYRSQVRIHLTVPKEYQKEERVQLEFDPSWDRNALLQRSKLTIVFCRCEAMVYSTEGLPLQGLTGGRNDERRVEFILKETRYPQTFYIEVSANGKAGGITLE